MAFSFTMSHKHESNIVFGFACLLILVHVSYGVNLGLISGDLKRISNPLIIRKTSHHSPVTINIKSGLPKLPKVTPPVLTSNLFKKPKKPSPLKTRNKNLSKPLRLRKLPKLPRIRKLPKIPKLPLLPLIPPLLPPIPKLPLLPLLPILPPLPLLPRLPILPRLSNVLKPIRIPILGRNTLKALGSEIRPVKVPAPNLKRHILDKLLKLRKDGSLTTAEFIRFKKLLL